MSRWIKLSDSRGRNARVRMESRRMSPSMCYQTMDGRKAMAARIIKAPLSKTYSYLRSRCQDDRELARLIMQGNPEIDLEAAGRKTGHTERILLDSRNQVLYAAAEMEVILDINGREIDRRPPVDTPANIDDESPLVWTGKMFKRPEAIRRFIFTRNYQIRHVDGLTFDFLMAMAAELDRLDSLVLIGAGVQGKEPLILERNGLPYRGFLEGRVKDGKYLLVMHLSHLELLQPL